MTPLQKLVYEAIRFSYLGAGEGLGLTDGETKETIWPEEFMMDYSLLAVDCDWETLAQRVADRVGELESLSDKFATGEWTLLVNDPIESV